MKNDARMRSVSVALGMAAILALVIPVAAWAQEIPSGGPTSLPDYVGAPAKVMCRPKQKAEVTVSSPRRRLPESIRKTRAVSF